MNRRDLTFILLALLAVLFMGCLNALVDAVLHPDIPFFDEEHLIVGTVTALTTALLLGSLLTYTRRVHTALLESGRLRDELEESYQSLRESQQVIIQQEKMACIGQLTAGLAHEINNPLGYISSNLNTLASYCERLVNYIEAQDCHRDSIPADAAQKLAELRRDLKIDYIIKDCRELLHESQQGAEALRLLVQDMKIFGSDNQGQERTVDLNQCLESTLNVVWNEIKYKATVTKELGKLPPLRCFPHQLNQVFMNLLVNGAQAIADQGEIAIRTWADDGHVFVTVTDSGSGIAQEHLHRVFEPFFTTKEVGEGSGLGLSISYDIVKKHGGVLSVESDPGRGTTFTVKLPVNLAPDAQTGPA